MILYDELMLVFLAVHFLQINLDIEQLAILFENLNHFWSIQYFWYKNKDSNDRK